jgi:tRNA pseudouridine32 synthase/23S rRNA pseudouridine746 synthase
MRCNSQFHLLLVAVITRAIYALTTNGIRLEVKRRTTGLSFSQSVESDPAFHIPILYESDRVLAINKPHGISHHSNGNEPGILQLLRQQLQQQNQSYRLYGVHRLDRVTSGILIFAKDVQMARYLTRAFRESSVIKYYVGLSCDKPTKRKQGFVQGGMRRGRQKSWLLTRQSDNNNQNINYAKTRFFTAGLGQCIGSGSPSKSTSTTTKSIIKTLLLFRPYTGKTHQLRAAAKAEGMPLAGDPVYSSTATTFERTYLHATCIHIPMNTTSTVNNSTTGQHEHVTIVSFPPFQCAFERERAFTDSVLRLLEKHVDCEELLTAINDNKTLHVDG